MSQSAVSSVLSQLASLVTQEAAFLRGVRDQVEWVQTELRRMQSFLEVAESMRRKGDKRVENWIREVRDVAYEVEDIIDKVKFMAERQRQRRGFMGSISRYSHKPCELITLHKMGTEIEKIKRKIQDISGSRATYGIPNVGEIGVENGGDRDNDLQAQRQFPDNFFDDTTDVIGFDEDKNKLVKQLMDPKNTNRSVISIVGMGGLGKTTLARKVCNDPEIKEQFHTFAWVSVSQADRGVKLLKDIMKKVMGIKKKKETATGITVEDLEQKDEEEVIERLRDFLGDKKYLVVMDDVWTVDVWSRIHQVFPNGNNGSRILLTTRYIEVARHAEPWIPPHELHLLNDTQSLELFCRKAIPPNQNIPAQLKELAQQLAKRCGGLPLALVVLGGLLSRKDRSYDAWSKVDQSMNWEDSRDGQECFKILGSSYNELPYQLKPCFLYIAAFPEDSIICVSKLVGLWTAEGFIPQEKTRTMEETARNCLDELVQRCMIQVVNGSLAYEWDGRIRIHDMLRELGISEAKKDGFLHVCRSHDMAISDDDKKSHRAAFHNLTMNDEVDVSSPHLRTLLSFNLALKDSAAAGRFLNGLKLLRVLDLEDAEDLEELPKEIGSMIHLRYLGLRNTGLRRLPSSIGNLLNLQTLDVRETYILWLPKSFWKIRTLRHVYINILMFLSAPAIGDHKNLQTLQITDVDVDIHVMDIICLLGIRLIEKWVTAPGFTEEAVGRIAQILHAESLRKALEKMDNLVSLSLEVDPFLKNILFAQAPNLHHLRSLNMRGQLLPEQQQLPDSGQFPPNLTTLILDWSKLEQDPMPVLEKLPNLRLLHLFPYAYVGKSMSCSAGAFPRLQQLILFALDYLEEWRVEDGAMPSLTHLTISYCRKLKMLPEGLQHVTTLRELKLIDMRREFNNKVRNEFRHIPSIIFEHEAD